LEERVSTTSQTFRVLGRRVPKVDAIDKVTGRAQYGADILLPRKLIGKVLRSPHAHARLRRIDTSQAAALPGVMAIITGNDLPALTPRASSPAGRVTVQDYYLSHEVLARTTVLYHGHAVAAVAATSEAIAEEALRRIQVDYEVLPHVLDPVQAMKSDAVVLHDRLFTQPPVAKLPPPAMWRSILPWVVVTCSRALLRPR
jgi:CO/xanthine dehydrogenase Mo-binding subunit